ncbi:retron system putative HNH endonuclease [Planktothrix mougeotii]|uniref:TIGR02646 family protein n=1 Tax=Planktothrix mougeotii LEGE 06226 TaxID=1828728 RepID=A0ABR9U8H5_9CYAN|nr:retron system putative HNH endonuclease [Planktothrix mougeotii]MBE9142750.1 TIGR02646 family protein [Planktothrix mougeotii LEGE 06226]
MKRIIKRTEPSCLLKYRQTANATYEDYRPKDPLKKALLEEQGYICCYCMKRISEENMEIEHFKPQSVDQYPELQLDYRNLLGSCQGNRGKPQQIQHCNARKGDKEIRLNPADPQRNCEDSIKYGSDGKIYSDDTTINHELDNILNLNNQILKTNRKKVLETIIDELNKRFPGKIWSKEFLRKKLNEWQNKNKKGQYNEYCQFVIYYLSKRL